LHRTVRDSFAERVVTGLHNLADRHAAVNPKRFADRIDKVLRLSDIEVAKMLENDPFKAKQIT
jgi:hypothetical protein